MRIVLIVILIDLFIFTLGAVFAEKEHEICDMKAREYHVDRFGYYWCVEE